MVKNIALVVGGVALGAAGVVGWIVYQFGKAWERW